jgi:hypothetical protein
MKVLPHPERPVVIRLRNKRAEDVQLRIADVTTEGEPGPTRGRPGPPAAAG